MPSRVGRGAGTDLHRADRALGGDDRDAGADVDGGASSPCSIGVPLGVWGAMRPRVEKVMRARPRRHADDPGLRLLPAALHVLRHRAVTGSGRDRHLRTAARGAAHHARHQAGVRRRPSRHLAMFGATTTADAPQGPTADGAADDPHRAHPDHHDGPRHRRAGDAGRSGRPRRERVPEPHAAADRARASPPGSPSWPLRWCSTACGESLAQRDRDHSGCRALASHRVALGPSLRPLALGRAFGWVRVPRACGLQRSSTRSTAPWSGPATTCSG